MLLKSSRDMRAFYQKIVPLMKEKKEQTLKKQLQLLTTALPQDEFLKKSKEETVLILMKMRLSLEKELLQSNTPLPKCLKMVQSQVAKPSNPQ